MLDFMVSFEELYVVSVNSPILVRLDLLDKYKMGTNDVHGVQKCHDIGCTFSLSRKMDTSTFNGKRIMKYFKLIPSFGILAENFLILFRISFSIYMN